ncbi:MAG: valine--tRNA ligase, partial [Actinomycetota bacterium]|nr:valine--tRNA ligase [Actinomycetota bacterium]
AVNPSDERYKGEEGKIVILPLVEKPIPVIADDYVNPDFGTGAVKVTPAHDPNDFDIGLRHNLEQVNILNPDGTIGENGGSYQGMDRYEAREAIVRDLRERGFLEKVEDYEHAVGHCYRCGTEIEPYLTTQWFVKMEPLAKPAIEAVRSGKTTFIPRRWEKIYFEWMENIKDWCISRQLWWGHRIPVWYCEECGKVIVSIDEPRRCSCGSRNLWQDPDVLDTWFSSGLWPFSTMGWPEKTDLLEVFYPTSVLVTAFDIIFFWVARMIMMGLRFMGDVPFREVLVTALVRDYEGKKMSKSSGNVIDPIDVIEKYGTDALRFSLASIAHPGRDINLSEEKIEGNRNFVNKIWNASRLVLMNLGDGDGEFSPRLYDDDSRPAALEELGEGIELCDRWILSRISRTISEVNEAMESYEFSIAGKALHQFFWGEFCDWYLELAKRRFYQGNQLERKAAQAVASCVLECSLRLLHPFMPFITEEIWQKIPGTGESIMVSSWPRSDGFPVDPQAEAEMSVIQPLVTGIRSARSEHGIPPSEKLDAVFVSSDKEAEKILVGNQSYIESLCGLSRITYDATALEGYTLRAVGIGVQAYLFVPQADIGGEVERLERKLKKITEELAKCQNKLSNEQFVKNAPAEVVEKEKEKEMELLQRKEKLEAQIESLKPGF